MGEISGVLLGNVSSQQAYGPVIAKMMTRAKTLCSPLLGMEEKTYLLTTSVAPVVFLTARAHEPTDKVLGQLSPPWIRRGPSLPSTPPGSPPTWPQIHPGTAQRPGIALTAQHPLGLQSSPQDESLTATQRKQGLLE